MSLDNKASKFIYLFDYVKKKVDLSEFLETEISCTLRWGEPNVSAKCICPFPDHREKKGSFQIRRMEDGVWVYHCFGCDASGTIIDFCQKYYDLKDPTSAVIFICKKFGFKDIKESDIDSFASVERKFDVTKKMECVHIEVANQCRRLLRQDYQKYGRWVSAAYKRMNKALDDKNIDVIEKISFEAYNKVGEK